MKYCVLTLGCKVNSYESDYVKEQFNSCGFKEVGVKEGAEIVVVNTCSVTNQSDAKSRQIIRLARRENPGAVLIVMGCSAQNHKEKLLDLGIDILIGTKDKSKILELINEYKESQKTVSKFYDMSVQDFEDMTLMSEENKTRAFVKIQDGCNNFCSYCIIPYLRGNIRSKRLDVAVKEISDLVNSGHSEVVLTGIHTGSYGRGEEYDLVDLIRKISCLEGLKRIRISSIEITELNSKFMEELKTNPKICDHLHIPLQSGSDTILNFMNRKYDTNYFLNKIEQIRRIRPYISITTDLILGFPHEEDKYFNETYEFLKKVRFVKIHTFPFSLRNGTKAEEMKEHFVNDTIKKERVRKVLELSKQLESDYYHKFIGKEVRVIIETVKDGISRGHTSNYILVNVNAELESGKEYLVKIVSVDGVNVNGELL